MSLLQLVLTLPLVLHASYSSALVVESPDCRLMTHVSGEFTNLTLLENGGLHNMDVVLVSPFTACEPLLSQNLTGKAALVLRGECNFVQKVWHAQRAHAAAVVVMDSALRHKPPYHIIMMKDDNASTIHIPSVFISYVSGEWLVDAISRTAPWYPLQITLNTSGELQASTSNRLLKRLVAYILLISIVCAFSSGLSLLSSAIFQWIGKTRRTRAAKKLPVAKYERNMQRTLLEHLLDDEFVLDGISMTEIESVSRTSNLRGETVLSSGPTEVSTHLGNIAPGADIYLENEQEAQLRSNEHTNRITYRSSNDSSAETCPICLEDFEDGTHVKLLPCKHFFHVNCINPWLEGQSGRCPLCKQDAIATIDGASKKILGFSLPRIDQILQQEQWVHTFFLMLPASLISWLIVNAASSIIGTMWP